MDGLQRSKSETQNRIESDSNGNRDEISRVIDEVNSIEGEQNLAESDVNEDNSLTDFIKPLSDIDSEQNSILITDKGSLKWQRNFEELRLVVDRLQLQSGTWTNPGGYCKLFDNGEVSIRWYSNSKTLTVKGEKANEIKEKLINFDYKSSGEAIVNHQSSKIGNLHSISESSDSNLHSSSRVCKLNTEMIQSNDHSYASNLNGTNFNKNLEEVSEFESKLERYTQNVTRKLEALADEISAIKENKENKAYAILVLEDVVNDLKKEKLQLNRENNELMEKNKNLLQSLSEARAKVLDLQDEKSSLMTALKLIQREKVPPAERKRIEELETENNSLRAAARSLQEDLDDRNKIEKRDFIKVKSWSRDTSAIPDTSNSYETKNQYEVLSTIDQEDDANISESMIFSKEPLEAGQQYESPNTSFTGKKSKPNILLIGDSMIKDINPHKLSKSSVRKLTFPGKRAEEIANEIQKAHVLSAPTDVIIHAGTNNLIPNSSKECCDNIEHLSSTIQNKFKDARIAISGLISRKDVDVALKIRETNKLLNNLCKKKGYTFIENENLDDSCLNGSKLHLNTKGSALLAVHFIKFLRNGRLPHSNIEDFPKQLQQLGELLRMILPQTPRKRTHR